MLVLALLIDSERKCNATPLVSLIAALFIDLFNGATNAVNTVMILQKNKVI